MNYTITSSSTGWQQKEPNNNMSTLFEQLSNAAIEPEYLNLAGHLPIMNTHEEAKVIEAARKLLYQKETETQKGIWYSITQMWLSPSGRLFRKDENSW